MVRVLVASAFLPITGWEPPAPPPMATRPMVKLNAQRLVPPAPHTLGNGICVQPAVYWLATSTGQAKMVTSPLPTSAAASVSFAVPVPSTACEQGVATGGAVPGRPEGQSVEVPPVGPATLA